MANGHVLYKNIYIFERRSLTVFQYPQSVPIQRKLSAPLEYLPRPIYSQVFSLQLISAVHASYTFRSFLASDSGRVK